MCTHTSMHHMKDARCHQPTFACCCRVARKSVMVCCSMLKSLLLTYWFA